MRDVWTVMWKELRELLMQRFGTLGSSAGILVVVFMFGCILPWQMGQDWVMSPMMWFLTGWTSFTLVVSVIADAFAGERERHTLETLLATRLSDNAILIGKVCAAVSYGSGIVLLILLMAWVTLNVLSGGSSFVFYDIGIGLGALVFGVLGAGLAASVGILVSLRAPTVRQAQQTLSLLAMSIPFAIGYGSQLLPLNWRAAMFQTLSVTSPGQILLWAGLTLLVLDGAMLFWARLCFRRDKLI